MQFGEVIKPVEGMSVRPGIIVDADAPGFIYEYEKDRAAAFEAAKRLGPRVIFLTTRGPEELGAAWQGRARVYQQGEDRAAAIQKAMSLMDVTQAVVVGESPTTEGRPVSYKHWSEAFGLSTSPEA